MEPTLLPARPGTISYEDKARLSEAGIIVIEHETPAELRLLKPSAEISGSAMLNAALAALTKWSSPSTVSVSQAQQRFVMELANAGIPAYKSFDRIDGLD